MFDFSEDNAADLEEKEIKRKTLLELIQVLEQPTQQRQAVLTQTVVKEVMETVAVNAFRTPK